MSIQALDKHPAKFSAPILTLIGHMLGDRAAEGTILDPFAGIGGVLDLAHLWPEAHWWLNELEPEWAAACEKRMIFQDVPGLVTAWDWLSVNAKRHDINTVITSCTYGNRMADNHTPSPEDTSRRITYRHTLGRPLTDNNSGGMQWGETYRHFHVQAWRKVHEALRDGGMFVLNVSDHIRGGRVQPVTAWHRSTIAGFGFESMGEEKVETKRMRLGANGDARVGYETVMMWRKPDGRKW